MRMLKKFFLISKTILRINKRKAQTVVVRNAFFLLVGLIVVSFSLFALGSIIAPSAMAITNSAALGGNARDFAAIIQSFFVNASMLASALYIFSCFFSSRGDEIERMLSNYGVSRSLRNLCFWSGKVGFLFATSLVLCSVLVFPGIFLSDLTLNFKITTVVFISIQAAFVLIFIMSLDIALATLLKTIRIPGQKGLKILLLFIIVGSCFWRYFQEISNAGVTTSLLLQLPQLMSFPLLAMYPAVGISPFNAGLSLLILVLSAVVSTIMLKIEDPRLPDARSFAPLKRMRFWPGAWSISTKVIKEMVRNKECMSSYLFMLLTCIACKFLNPEIFNNDLFALSVAFPAVNFLYATSHENKVRHLYMIRRLSPIGVFFANALAPLIIAAFQAISLCLFFPTSVITLAADSIIASFAFTGGGFYLLGILFPIDEEHPFSSSLIIALLVLALMPILIILFQFASYINMEIAVIQVLAGALGLFCFLPAYMVYKKKIRLQGEQQ